MKRMTVILCAFACMACILSADSAPAYGASTNVSAEGKFILASASGEAAPSSAKGVNKLWVDDNRIYKSDLTGKYVSEDNPDYYFEIFNDYALISKAFTNDFETEKRGGSAIEPNDYELYTNYDFPLEIDFHGGLTWLHFDFSIWITDEEHSLKHLYFYTSDPVAADTFVYRNTNFNSGLFYAPYNQMVFKRAGEKNRPDPETLLELDRETAEYMAEKQYLDDEKFGQIGIDDEGNPIEFVALSTEKFFPNVRNQIYFLEILAAVGEENVTISRQDDSLFPIAAFRHEGYVFWYYVLGEWTYDLHKGDPVFVYIEDQTTTPHKNPLVVTSM